MYSGPGKMILANLALYVVVLGILVPIRQFSRWQLTQPDVQKDTPAVYLEHNFGINHLLILTAIVALACGLVVSLFIITVSTLRYSSVADFISSLSLITRSGFPSWYASVDHTGPPAKDLRVDSNDHACYGSLECPCLLCDGANNPTMALVFVRSRSWRLDATGSDHIRNCQHFGSAVLRIQNDS